MNDLKLSIVLPAKNEAAAIGDTISRIRHFYPSAEVILVNDGSTDDTSIPSHSGLHIQ